MIINAPHFFPISNNCSNVEDVIIHLIDTSVGSIEDFSSLVRKHTSAKRCFVIVNVDLNQEDFENLIIIPTLQEAHDFIEMEVMQRDLGL